VRNDGAEGALAGIRVIDAGLLVQGPQAGLTLSDLGADVVKVELPGVGDQARWIPIGVDDPRSPYHVACNRGKRSITLDLRVAPGKEAFVKLVQSYDVLLSNFAPGTLDDWGLGYETLSALNPRLIYATGSVYGPEGPSASAKGADLAAQAAGGLISTTGVDGSDPTPIGATIADHIASQNMTAGILAAIIARSRTGRGQRVDVSLFGGQIYAQAAEYTHYFLSGQIPGRSNYGHPLLNAAYGIVPTSDGWLAIVGVPVSDRSAFYAALERPELAEDERFTPLIYTTETKRELFEIFAQVFPTRTTAEWSERLAAANCRFAPVNNYAQAASDPHAAINGYILDVDHPEWGKTRVIGCPIGLSETPARPSATAPELGQDTEEVLLELGYSWNDIAALRDAGAI
jgi:crotonobetainyl-CoA:carnitine CoA-transferase CaiB-like acyl-CoA transferase